MNSKLKKWTKGFLAIVEPNRHCCIPSNVKMSTMWILYITTRNHPLHVQFQDDFMSVSLIMQEFMSIIVKALRRESRQIHEWRVFSLHSHCICLSYSELLTLSIKMMRLKLTHYKCAEYIEFQFCNLLWSIFLGMVLTSSPLK